MGSRSKSSSSNTSGQTQSTMNNLAKGRVSNSSMMDLLSQMQGGQLGQMLPIFDALTQNGNSMMGSNPMMQMFGGQQQAPQQSLSEIFQSMQPQQPQQQMPPVSPFMWGKHIVDQGVARGGRTPPRRASLYEQMAGNPYAGIQKDV